MFITIECAIVDITHCFNFVSPVR